MKDEMHGLRLPLFFSYFDSPVKIVPGSGGGVAAWRLSKETGGWRPADDLINKLIYVGGDEIVELTQGEFVQHVEHDRGYYRNGREAVAALYETVRAIEDAADSERRSLTATERAMAEGIRRKTFVMFEKELQRKGDPGADPTLADGA